MRDTHLINALPILAVRIRNTFRRSAVIPFAALLLLIASSRLADARRAVVVRRTLGRRFAIAPRLAIGLFRLGITRVRSARVRSARVRSPRILVGRIRI